MRRIGGALLAVVLFAAGPLHAETGVTLADGRPAGDADLASVARALPGSADSLVAIALPLPSEEWTGTLRTTACADAPAAVALGDVVVAARQQISMLAAEAAERALEEAIRQLPCATGPITRADLLAAFEILGEAAQVAGHEGNARFAYEGLLGVAPGYALTSPPGTGYEELFNAVRRSFVNQDPTTIGLHHTLPEHRAVVWDGAPVAASSRVPLAALPGRHLLQWTEDGVTRGAWVELPAGGVPAALVRSVDRVGLLAQGLSDAGARAAIEPLLRALAQEVGVEGIVVLAATGDSQGYAVTPESADAWAASSLAIGRSMAPDRLRLAVGAGYANLQLTHYGDVTAAIDIRLVGPLHLRVEGDLALSQPLDGRIAGYDDQDKVAVLPGVGAGVVVHPARGLIQPFGALTAGVWIGALDAEAAASLEAALASGGLVMGARDRAKLAARHAVDFRGFLDGGLDLVPLGGPLMIRVGAGVGLGLALTPDAPVGFQFRAGVAVGVRLGMGRRAQGG